MICKNCNHPVSNKYCENCGQKVRTEQLTYAYIMKDLNESFFSLNKGFFHTFRELTCRPAQCIREFLAGKRRNHYKPISYLILCASIYFLFTKLTNQNTWLAAFLGDFTTGFEESSSVDLPAAIHWFAQNYAYATLLLIPLFALLTRLFFRKDSYNYIEHIALNSYIAGHQSVIYIFFAVSNLVLNTEIEIQVLSIGTSLAYCTWVLSSLFKSRSTKHNIIRVIGVYLLYLLSSVLLLAIIIAISAFLAFNKS